ncbi:MAG: 4-hydroxythreonine-4-phosphate dehydrogenase PdxA [Cyclobacteriaceae bacterium]|nr:4-hydroxythreonine-4-phosphate dehydrogenase PdxA [Cyclobacteriaceae bacterium]
MDIAHKKAKTNKPIIGITIGDINGIGPEVIIKALSDSRVLDHITPVVFGSTKVLSFYRKMLNFEDFHYSQLRSISDLNLRKINVVNCWPEMVEIKVGQVTKEAGNCAYLALREAVNYLKEDKIDAIVTAPINKKNIQRDDFKFVGHTDFISEELGANENLMLMVNEDLRIGVVTAHVPISEVSQNLTEENIELKLKIMIKTLKNDFGIDKPKVAILGLNPHAGEDGLLGKEESEIIEPVITKYKNKGHLVFGPFPADGFFGTLQYQKYDGILAMYHDQGLIPFKMLGFESGVNFTAGIPKVRTSPDHGTAYSIAGKNVADPSSMREALYLASSTVKIRNMSIIPV